MTLLSDDKYQLFLPPKKQLTTELFQNSGQNLRVVIKFFTMLYILCRKRPFLDGYNCTTLVVLSHSTFSDKLNKVAIAYQSND